MASQMRYEGKYVETARNLVEDSAANVKADDNEESAIDVIGAANETRT